MSEDSAMHVPKHIGFILDGNRRWARMHSIPDSDGHMAGYNALKEVLYECCEKGITYVSLYVFSTENWKRPSSEVSAIMRLALTLATIDLKQLIKRNVRVRFIGRRQGLPANVAAAFDKAEAATEHLKQGTVAICFNYGGQQEIADAAKQCVVDGLSPDEITETAIADRLYAPDLPPIDMVVRTSGEQRISNFMLWRTAYSEFLFLDKYWPDMTKEDVTSIIEEYNRRSRRFGG
jgi:undecaprenyl diphosphate synthase